MADSVPKISVVSACFNHGKFVLEMIDSVLNQTFQDFELIIVNDGSTDSTAEILNSLNHEKIQVIHAENRGPSNARNRAISIAKAPWILNLDSDDKIAPDLLEKAYNVFCINPDAGIVYTNCKYFGARSGIMRIPDYSPEKMLFENSIVSAAFFRKDDWHNCGGYSDAFIYGLEDWDFWLKVIELGKSVIRIPDSFFYYRTHKNPNDSRSGRRKSDRDRSLYSLSLIFERHKALYSRYPAAWKRFSSLGKQIQNENLMMRQFRNFIFRQKQRYSHLVR